MDGNARGMVTNESFAGQRKQLGRDVCTTAVVTLPSWEHEEGENQLGHCKLQQKRVCLPSLGT